MLDQGAMAASCLRLVSAQSNLWPDVKLAPCGGWQKGTSPRGRANMHLLLMMSLLITGFYTNSEELYSCFAQLLFLDRGRIEIRLQELAL